jgi:type IVB pilus formation R64 PilN family outer membrane protein
MGMTAVVQTESELRTTYELNYQGSLAGLLDQLADKAGLQWRYQDGRIVFSRMVTRVFTIKSLFGGVKTSSQLTLGTSATATSTTDSDLWSALEINLKSQLSTFGKLQVDSRGGTVTVTYAKPNEEANARLIQVQNDTMMRQVILEVEVLQVDLRQEQHLGINWSAVGSFLDAANISTLVSPTSLTPYSGNTGGALTFSRGNFKLLIAALEEFGKVNTAYSAVLTTTNRQPVPLGVTSNEGYLKQVAAGTVSSTGASTGSTLTAGTITTGFSLVVTPMVLDSGRVLLESALSVTALRDLKSFSSGVGPLMNSIQLPAIDEFSTLQRLSVKLGDTLVMTGFEREILLRDDLDVVRGVIPGSQRSKSMRQSTVIIITPRLGAP